MLRNYLLVALRNLKKQKSYSLINVLGLGIGIASSLIILLFVFDELSYDSYHKNADSVYRVAREWVNETGETTMQLARISAPIGPALENGFPEVEEAIRIWGGGGVVSRDDEFFNEGGFYFAEQGLFDLFTSRFIEGNAESALSEPFTVVLTRSMANKYFGDEAPLGGTIRLDDEWDLTVRGVVEDPPHNTHFDFDFLASFATLKSIFPESSFTNWTGSNNYATYVRLADQADAERVEERLPAFLAGQYDEEPGERSSLFLQPITDIHLHSSLDSEFEPGGDIMYVYLFSFVAFFILLIACFNFMSLATARAFRRVTEIGIRKALGAIRSQLVGQFLGETLVLSVVALLLAAGLTRLLLPVFNAISGKSLSLFGGSMGLVLGGLAGLSLLAGLIAGSYPALYLSGFRPADSLRGGRTTTGGGASGFRKLVVVTQFVFSIALIGCTAVVYRQIDYVQHKDLGFKSENLVVLPGTDEITQDMAAIRSRLSANPNILSVTASRLVPADRLVDHIDGRAEVEGQLKPFNGLPLLPADQEFVRTYGIDLVAGRSMDVQRAGDSTEAYILNESAVARLGWSSAEEAIGKQLILDATSFTRPGTVIGVVRDFHFESLRERISPLVMFVMPERHRLVTVRTTGNDPAGTIDFLKKQWAGFRPNFPFTYRLIDRDFDALYRSEKQMGDVIGSFALLAILVACLGLFGLAAYMAQQRTKEIGIRKTLGASALGIVGLLTQDFAKLVAIAFVIAAPLAWFLMHRWLQDFAYAIEPGPGVFLAGGGAVLGLALITVSYQAIRAALSDPVKSLRYE